MELLLDLLMLALPFVILRWATRGRGIMERARVQAMTWCCVALGAYWGGVPGALGMFLVIVVAIGWVVARQELPTTIDPVAVHAPIQTLFRGSDLSTQAASVGARHLGAFEQPLANMTLTSWLFEVDPGTLLRFDRFTATNVTKDVVWLHSYLDNGIWVESSDEIQSMWDVMPHERMHDRFTRPEESS